MKALATALICTAMLGTTAACSGSASDEPATTKAGTETCQDVDLSAPPSKPTTIRIGHGAAAEEPFWNMAKEGADAEYSGSWYELKLSPFRGTAQRLTAYQAGDLDAIMISPQAQIIGTARGALNLYTIGTVMREADPDAFSTSAVVMEDSGIDDLDDLKGKKIAIVDEGSLPDFVARQGLREAGLDPARDAEFVVLPFPSQEEALRSGQIDVALLPEPFYSVADGKGGVKRLFDASDITDFSYDLLTLSFDKKFVEKNVGAVCAWAADFAASMDEYIADPDEVKRGLVGTKFVTLPEAVYLKSTDYARPSGGVVDTEGTQKMMDAMIEFGVIEESDRIDVKSLVRDGISLGH